MLTRFSGLTTRIFIMKEPIKKCFRCGHRAYYRFSPDLDISGLGACKKHLKMVKIAYILLLSSGTDGGLFDEMTKGWWGTTDLETAGERTTNHVTGEKL